MQASIILSHLDALTYLDIRRETEIAAAEREAGDDLLLPALHQDVWASAYLPEPELAPQTHPHLAVERRLIERLLTNPAWEEVREQTVFDEWLSAALTVPTAQKLLALIPEEAQALQREAVLQERRVQEMREKAQELREQGHLQQAQELEDTAAQAEAQAQAAAQQVLEKMEEMGEELERGMARAAFEAAETAQSVQDAIDTFRGWGTEPGRPHAGVPGREVMLVAERLAGSRKLRDIMKLAGRFTRIVLQKRRSKIKQEPTELVEIETGGDLSRVLPGELVSLADPVRRMDFYRRFAEKKLLQYRLDARAPHGRGPLVVCVDESGSMAGEKEIWAKAVALAGFMLAAKEKRGYALIHFGYKWEIRVDRFPNPRKASPAEVLSAVEHFFGGGTDFETPLEKALEILEESPFKYGDIIFITDAICWVSDTFMEKFNKVKQQKEFSVFSILVEKGMEESVKPFSDMVTLALPGKNDVEILEKISVC
ncbi:MAG: VWA domain-containing protein [Thermacetogeniaceae bacterium]